MIAKGVATVLVLAIAIAVPMIAPDPATTNVAVFTMMYVGLATSWNIMGGFAGMFSFGQVAFFGIGAYTSSYLLVTHHVSPWIGLLVGGVAAALVAAAIGWPCSNLRGHYFAIASIAFAEIVRIHFNNWKLIGAAEGLTLPMLPESFRNFMFHTSKAPYYYIILAFLLSKNRPGQSAAPEGAVH